MARIDRRIVLLGVALSIATLSARQQAPASASIRGSVRDAQGAPVPGVFAVVFPSDSTKWSGLDAAKQIKRMQAVAGRYAIDDLPAGDYRLVFAIDSALQDWPAPATLQKLTTQKPMPIRLAAGEQVTVDAVVRLSNADVVLENAMMARSSVAVVPSGSTPFTQGNPGNPAVPGSSRIAGPPVSTAPGSISGRVTDADGQPVAGIDVRSVRRVTLSGVPQVATFGQGATTDADGRYRLTGRAIGDYMVVALAYSMQSPGIIHVRRAPPPTVQSDGVKLGYVTTFFGGTTDDRGAPLVSVGTDERAGIDIQLVRRPVFDARVVFAGGRPPTGPQPMLTVSQARIADQIAGINVRRVAMADDGSFAVPDLPDGEYVLSFNGPSGSAISRLVVAGRTPDVATLGVRPPVYVTGQVEYRGASAPPAAASNPMQFGIELAPAVLTAGATMSRVRIQPDGSFNAPGTGAGPFKLRGFAPAPWIQIMGLIDGVDTLDLPAAIDRNIEGALIVFADRATGLLINVRDQSDQPVPEAGVVVFSDDPRYWSGASRRVQFTLTTSGGVCSLTDFPPGRYLIAAGRDLAAFKVGPASLESLKPRAIPFELATGESRSIRVTAR